MAVCWMAMWNLLWMAVWVRGLMVVNSSQDFESEPKTISFAKNGTMFETAYELEPAMKDKALFPHVATKNVRFSVNFGSPVWCETPDIEGYLPMQEAVEEHRVRGPVPPNSCSECEVLMMIGLPSSGKTTWAKKYCSQNKDKRYIILGEPSTPLGPHP